jgi:tetratricopeptide (TPR) repeat protein
MLIKRVLYLFGLIFILASCSTKKNTFVGRGYHNITTRYNSLYYSTLNLNEGIYKFEKTYKDNFDKILPVYIYPPAEKTKASVAEFDKAIKKSSLAIQKHAIKDKKNEVIPSSGKWIDDNWINIGIAHIYKREFFSGLESFEYVAKTFKDSKDKYTALLWMIKANNEIGSVSTSEPLISLLKNEKKLPKTVASELPVAQADYYMRRGQNTEAAAKLMEAMRNGNIFTGISKKRRGRYSFIIAQLFEAQKENKRAILYYKKTIRLKPNYDMIFYSKIKMARLLDVKRNNSEKTKKDLLKMSKEFKNSDYYDVIFYTLGEIEEKESNIDKAVYYYKRSVQTSSVNPTQKALSYLKLGEINFDLANYQPSGAYYDSAVVTLPKDHPNYNNVLVRKKTLEILIKQIKTIRNEDSLQRIANMSESERNSFIDKIIANKEKEEERKQKEKEALQNSNAAVNQPGVPGGPVVSDPGNPGAASFYFYNPNTVSLGVGEFVKKWGNRKHEENWRRSNKALVVEDNTDDPAKQNDQLTNKKEKDPAKLREAYKKNLPVNDSLIAKSTDKIIEAFYLMGSIYKEELNNTQKAVAAFEELNRRYPKNKYLLNNYYVLYRIYQGEKKESKADFYKEKILNEFPDSEFALLIKNPNGAVDISARKSEVESFYSNVYSAYQQNNYSEAFALSKEGIEKFGKNDYLPKFEFIKALSTGKIKGVDSLEYDLKLLVARYPKAEVTPLANDILLAIKKQKNPDMFKPNLPGKMEADTFTVNYDAEHFLIAIVPDDPKIANGLKTNIDAFNTKFYASKPLSITSNLFGQNKQLIILKSFANAEEVMAWYENFMNDKDSFKGDVKKELVEIYPVSAANLPFLYKRKNPEAYKLFFLDNYKKFMNRQ